MFSFFKKPKPKEDTEPSSADLDEAAADLDSEEEEAQDESWLGVGFDGTLAECPLGETPDEPGPAVPSMILRVQDWHDMGLRVKIFTWRGTTAEGRALVQDWLVRHGLPALEVTDTKDFNMVEFWDARAVQVIRNTGQAVGNSHLPAPEPPTKPTSPAAPQGELSTG